MKCFKIFQSEIVLIYTKEDWLTLKGKPLLLRQIILKTDFRQNILQYRSCQKKWKKTWEKTPTSQTICSYIFSPLFYYNKNIFVYGLGVNWCNILWHQNTIMCIVYEVSNSVTFRNVNTVFKILWVLMSHLAYDNHRQI